MRFLHPLLRTGGFALAGLAASAAAGILAVYGPRGIDTEILKNAAESLRGQVGTDAAQGASGALTWRWTPGSVLGPEFSFDQAEAAYFLTENPVRFGPGFTAKGLASFGVAVREVKPTPQAAPSWNDVVKISRKETRLLLGYPLSEAGKVRIEVYSVKGARLAQWSGWQQAGSHVQPVPLPAQTAGEMLVVRWRFKEVVSLRRVNP